MTLRAVFLDLYGTLLDPESDRHAHALMVEAMAQHFGLEEDVGKLLTAFEAVRENYFGRARGWTAREVIVDATAEWLRAYEADLNIDDEEWLKDVYRSMHMRHLRLYSDARTFLEGLRPLAIHRGLISDIDLEFLGLVRKTLGLDTFLHSYTTSEEVSATKPDLRPFMAALVKAGCRPSEAIHIGDQPLKDVAGARAAGMLTMLRRRTGVDGGEADFAVDDLTDALPILHRLLMGEDEGPL